VLIAGQSNAVGRGDSSRIPEAHRSGQAQLLYSQSLDVSRVTPWRPLEPPIRGSFGIEVSLAADLASAGRTPLLLKIAKNATSLAEDWDPESGRLYGEFLRVHAVALEAAPCGVPSVVAIVWLQGESDARRLLWASAYGAALKAFIGRLRSDINAPDASVILGVLPEGLREPYVSLVRKGQLALGAERNTRLVDMNGLALEEDGLHLATGGLIELGFRIGSELKPLLATGPAP